MTQPNNPQPKTQEPNGLQWLLRTVTAPVDMVTGLIEKFNNLPQTNFDLGCRAAERGDIYDAIFRFKMVLMFSKSHAPSHYNLGCCFLARGDVPRAMKHFADTLKYNPGHEDARFMLASLRPAMFPPDQQPKQMPLNLAVSYFDGLAGQYNQQLSTLGYVGHDLIFSEVSKLMDSDRIDYRLVDLGCGTGWCGMAFRSRVHRLTGVDISRRMLEQVLSLKRSSETGSEAMMFDELIHNDLRHYLGSSEEPRGDILIAGDVAPYIGDLRGVMEGAHKSLSDGGLFAMTFEPFGGQGFGLMASTGRYGHTPDYVQNEAERAGFTVRHLDAVQLYPNMPAYLAVLQKV